MKSHERHALGHALSASDISQICVADDITIPGVNMEDQTIEKAPMQIGAGLCDST
jgi:hypothetical protein